MADILVGALSTLPTNVNFLPCETDFAPQAHVQDLAGIPVVQLFPPALTTFDKFCKRVFDLVIAIIALIVFLPLLVIISIVVKLDSSGPVFYKQLRHGYKNRPFNILKFRTLYPGEDDYFSQVVKGDARVTRIGRILRRTNIDELPQLLNVLHGTMSIVGPRPHAVPHNESFGEALPNLWRRHSVKPGITGWAQVNGCRGETDTVSKMEKRLNYDLHYIEHWSLFLDVKIVFMTLFSKSAYTNAY